MSLSRVIFLMVFAASVILPLHTGRAQSQSEMNAQASEDLDKADQELNRLYKKILSARQADAKFCSDLREAQRAWLKYVDYHLKTCFPLDEGENPREVYGSIYPLDYATTKTALLQERIKQFKSLGGED